MITAYLDGDERIISYVDEVKQQSKTRKARTKKLRDQGKQTVNDLGLSEQQVHDLFDTIAEEYPDL